MAVEAGKSALVLFYDMNSCVQHKVSTTWLFYLTLVCPLLIALANICYNLLSFVIINCVNAHVQVITAEAKQKMKLKS